MVTGLSAQDAQVLPAAEVAAVLGRLRERAPLVHCMTNIVVAGFTANVLLAVGASPAMVENEREAAEFAAVADGLLINFGTLSEEIVRAMRMGSAAAREAGTPWVFDPVGVGPLAFRTGLAVDLMEQRPTVVRGNPSEVLSLAGATGTGRGVDSTAESAAAVPTARDLAARTGGAVAVSGAVDYITDGSSLLSVANGHPLMTKVTGVGCALGALVTACCAVEDSPLIAAAAATTILTVSAEVAAASSTGTGSFAVGLLDALSVLDEAVLAERVGA